MTYKQNIRIYTICLCFLVQIEAIRRGGTSRSRIGTQGYSVGNFREETTVDDPGRAILAIIFMILSCGGGMGWKIYQCYRKDKQRRRFIQPQLPDPNRIYANSISPSNTTDRFNQVEICVNKFENNSTQIV